MSSNNVTLVLSVKSISQSQNERSLGIHMMLMWHILITNVIKISRKFQKLPFSIDLNYDHVGCWAKYFPIRPLHLLWFNLQIKYILKSWLFIKIKYSTQQISNPQMLLLWGFFIIFPKRLLLKKNYHSHQLNHQLNSLRRWNSSTTYLWIAICCRVSLRIWAIIRRWLFRLSNEMNRRWILNRRWLYISLVWEFVVSCWGFEDLQTLPPK